jgi:polyhydroxyalkanoate synthase subunit PhaC
MQRDQARTDMNPWDFWTQSWVSGFDLYLRALEPVRSESERRLGATAPCACEPPEWTTPNREVFNLASLRLRDFSCAHDAASNVLIVAPYALHDAGLADLAPGHSLIEALLAQGCSKLFLVEWLSADANTKLNTIDMQLAALNVAVDEIGPPLDLIGLCQGGWLSLVYAARFPHKVRRLVLVGAPIDTKDTGSVVFSRAAKQGVDAFISELIRQGDGLVLGRHTRNLWPGDCDDLSRAAKALEIPLPLECEQDRRSVEIFARWDRRLLDLPGPFYREVFTWLYHENRLARGGFPALGKPVDLSQLALPVYLLAGAQDCVTPPASAFSAASLLGARKSDIETALAPCGHHALIMGKRTLANEWPRIAAWLQK